MKYLYKKLTLLLLIFFFFASLVLVRWANIPWHDTLYNPRCGIYGDVWSCYDVQSAAKYFKDYGFTKTKFLPVLNYKGGQDTTGSFVYMHYPALPYIIAGLYADASGSTDAKSLSLLPMLVSVLFFFFIFYSLQVIYDDKAAAFVAATLTVCSCYLICWADDIHQGIYGELCKWAFVFLLYIYYNTDKYKIALLAVMCLLYLANAWISFEHIVYFAIVVAGFSLVYRKKLFTRENFLLLSIPFIGVGLHLFQNYLFLKNWRLVFNDIAGAAIERTVGKKDTLAMDWGKVKEIPSKLFMRFDRMYFINANSFLILAFLGMRQLYFSNRKHFQIGIILFLASISWAFIMPQHIYIHYFTIRHWGLFFAFIIGTGIWAYLRILKKHWQQKQPVFLLVHFAFIMYTFIYFLSTQVYYVYLKFGYGFPILGLDSNL